MLCRGREGKDTYRPMKAVGRREERRDGLGGGRLAKQNQGQFKSNITEKKKTTGHILIPRARTSGVF